MRVIPERQVEVDRLTEVSEQLAAAWNQLENQQRSMFVPKDNSSSPTSRSFPAGMSFRTSAIADPASSRSGRARAHWAGSKPKSEAGTRGG